MDPQRWREVRALFDALVEMAAAERAQRLAAIGETDAELRDAVASLLAAEEQADERLRDIDAALLAGGPQPSETGAPHDPFGLTGCTLAHFRVLEPLGAGGMGVVYRAEDTRLGRKVALKVPFDVSRLDEPMRQRFLHEARSAAALDHPNLCSILEVGEGEEGQPFLAMPLYAGETLKARLARERALPIETAVDIARQIAEGLAAAHAGGVVHRDVKPGNVMLLPNGCVKILDFGLAKMRDLTLTRSRAQLGTVGYMAPEQIRGRGVDARTDLWALGVVLYEMLTGRRPFEGESDVSVAHAIVHEEPVRPSTLRSDLPAHLENLLFLLLGKNPAGRPTAAEQVVCELSAFRPGRPLPAGRAIRHRWAAVTGWRRRRAARTAAAALLAAALGTGAVLAARLARHPPPSAPAQGSIAVLPFANLSGQPDQEYFSDGIADELTSHLARVEGLRVAARTSAFRFRGEDADVREVGRALGVAAVLEGTVRRSGNRVRISAQLIDAATGYQVWSDTYDRELRDIFALQEEISRAILTALRLRLPDPIATRARATRSAEAHDRYLMGRYFWNQRTEESIARAAEYFREAVALDPQYAEAHVGLADAEIAPGGGPPAERFARAKAAASRALALDSTLAEAHVSMAWIRTWYDRDWSGAERQFQRAIELGPPSYSWVFAWYGAYLAAVGRLDEALVALVRAHDLDPLTFSHTTHVGTIYLWSRRYDDASAYFRKALELAPDFYMAHWGLARVHLSQGRTADALAELLYDGADYTGFHRGGLLGYAHALGGNETEARRILAQLHDDARNGEYVAPVDVAIIHIALGEHARALDWLERLVHDRGARIFLIDPIFDPVRADPRFQRVLQSLGLQGLAGLR